MKIYSKKISIKYTKNNAEINLNSNGKIDISNDNMEFVLIDMQKDFIELKGNYITVLFQNKCDNELNYNKNERIPITSVRKKYLTRKKKYNLFGKCIDVITEGAFELCSTNNRSIKLDNYSIENRNDCIILSDESYNVMNLLLNKYNAKNNPDWIKYSFNDWFKDSIVSSEEEFADIIVDLTINNVIEMNGNYWRLITVNKNV